MTICNKCKWLWRDKNKFYCIAGKSVGDGKNVAYSKNKKECKCFEEGQNVRYWMSRSTKYRERR